MKTNDDILTVWTIQPIDVYEALQQNGEWHCDGRKSSYLRWMREAYIWMSNEMKTRVEKPPHGISYPVWAYYIINGKNKKPDFREFPYCQWTRLLGRSLACMQLSIPNSKCLLSDEGIWDNIINGMYVPQSDTFYGCETESAAVDAMPSSHHKDILVHDSWNRVFDLKRPDGGYFGVGENVQCTFWQIHIDMLENVSIYTPSHLKPLT